MNFGGKPDIRHYLDLRWICLISFINFIQRMEQLASTLFDAFKHLWFNIDNKYLHKKNESWVRMSLCVCCDGGLEAPSVGQDAGEVI